jgi:DNA-binding response OmpR family regulator
LNNTFFLIVDDSSTIRELVCKALKTTMGVQNLSVAEDGKAALQILREKRIDIIISDWNMPRMDGEELLYQVRNDPDLKKIPFIMMTTNADRDFIITAIQLGVTQYIVKPFSPKELEEKIRLSLNTISKRQAERYALPDHVATVRVGQKSFVGRILDMSRTGALMTLEYDESMCLYKTCEIELELTGTDTGNAPTSLINGLGGTIVRLGTESTFHPTSRRCQMALYFHPGNMERDVERRLNNLIKWLSSKTPDVIGDN